MSEWWLEEVRNRVAQTHGGIMFDIGANAGEWSAWGAHHFASVVAVDCDKRAVQRLRERFAAVPSISVIYNAVSDQCGGVAVYQRPDAEQTSLLEEHPIGAGSQAPAPVESIEFVGATTIDTLICRYGEPAFIKVDVEGAEGMVLTGATLPPARRAHWLIEVHDTSEAVAEEVERLGWEECTRISHPHQGAHPGHYWIFLEGQR